MSFPFPPCDDCFEDKNMNERPDLDAITEAAKHFLGCEIIWSAFQAYRDNPKLSIKEAIDYGFNEWVK